MISKLCFLSAQDNGFFYLILYLYLSFYTVSIANNINIIHLFYPKIYLKWFQKNNNTITALRIGKVF